MAPNTAIVTAGPTNPLMVSHERAGNVASGSSEWMLKRSPIVSMVVTPAYCLSNKAATVMIIIATNEPGTFLLTRGVSAMIMTLATPITVLQRSIFAILLIYATHFSMKSAGTVVICIPNKSFT